MQEFCAATKEYCPPGKAGMPGTPGTHGIMGLKGKRGSRGRPGSKVKLSSYYRKIASYNTSCLEAHVGFFRLFMKGIFGPYVLLGFEKKLIFQ